MTDNKKIATKIILRIRIEEKSSIKIINVNQNITAFICPLQKYYGIPLGTARA